MRNELLDQTIAIFDTPEKWNAYFELSKCITQIKSHWIQNLRNNIFRAFSKEMNTPNGWSFKSFNVLDFKWFLTDFGEYSFCIYSNYGRIGLWVDSSKYDTQKVSNLLKKDKYTILLSAFKQNSTFNGGQWLVIEDGNFTFDSQYDTNFNFDILLWYAENKADSYINQLVEKVDRIRRDPLMTDLFKEINQLTKKY